jgi:hypothetical protein
MTHCLPRPSLLQHVVDPHAGSLAFARLAAEDRFDTRRMRVHSERNHEHTIWPTVLGVRAMLRNSGRVAAAAGSAA